MSVDVNHNPDPSAQQQPPPAPAQAPHLSEGPASFSSSSEPGPYDMGAAGLGSQEVPTHPQEGVSGAMADFLSPEQVQALDTVLRQYGDASDSSAALSSTSEPRLYDMGMAPPPQPAAPPGGMAGSESSTVGAPLGQPVVPLQQGGNEAVPPPPPPIDPQHNVPQHVAPPPQGNESLPGDPLSNQQHVDPQQHGALNQPLGSAGAPAGSLGQPVVVPHQPSGSEGMPGGDTHGTPLAPPPPEPVDHNPGWDPGLEAPLRATPPRTFSRDTVQDDPSGVTQQSAMTPPGSETIDHISATHPGEAVPLWSGVEPPATPPQEAPPPPDFQPVPPLGPVSSDLILDNTNGVRVQDLGSPNATGFSKPATNDGLIANDPDDVAAQTGWRDPTLYGPDPHDIDLAHTYAGQATELAFRADDWAAKAQAAAVVDPNAADEAQTAAQAAATAHLARDAAIDEANWADRAHTSLESHDAALSAHTHALNTQNMNNLAHQQADVAAHEAGLSNFPDTDPVDVVY